jgi:hypothetical protein
MNAGPSSALLIWDTGMKADSVSVYLTMYPSTTPSRDRRRP